MATEFFNPRPMELERRLVPNFYGGYDSEVVPSEEGRYAQHLRTEKEVWLNVESTTVESHLLPTALTLAYVEDRIAQFPDGIDNEYAMAAD